ncbi:DUF998 domain-containing protein [Micromonospora sp. ALFpr18c]|uniref:DUF998 domain-containing protein n=1 Tax=unclassified Micromonospora TaxID=2617518 RepID=UPI001788BCB1|nr:DUF998 domain-containing protein [Micromonospora sp. ALFpr18c]
MRPVALISAAAAPILLIGGWTVAESLQPPGFDPLHDTISQLAALDARDRGVMTTALVGTGLAYLCTAFGLTEVARVGRLLLAIGGVGTIMVAVFPLPADPTAHGVSAGVAFIALAAWPFFAVGGSPDAPWTVRRPFTIIAGLTLLALVAWFGAALQSGNLVGLAERIAAGAQATWPLIVAVSLFATSRRRPAAAGADAVR